MAKKLTMDDVTWSLRCDPEHIPIEGNAMASGDDAYDRQVEQSIRDDLEAGNEWAWCSITVTGRFKGLIADDHLGACSYGSEREFIEESLYYDDMRSNVLDELQTLVDDLAAAICE